jgi:glyoxylase I family protein
MARVTGIGGFFFRSRDPDALNRWYGEHLGVVMLDSRTYDDPGWFQDRGECVSPPSIPDSKLPGPLEKSWMINVRVDDLGGMVEKLRATGVAVEPHPEPYPNGRFAELEDAEGNRIQLWSRTPPPSREIRAPSADARRGGD